MCRVATECSWNDRSKAQYYVVILDRLLGRSGGLERAPEWRVRGPLTHSVEALLDCRATGSLINRDFIRSKGMNTQILSHNILVFNVNSSPNEAGQISEVMDIVLCYKTHSERMLLAVSGLGKQSLILGYNWLKDYNPKINWEKGEVEMTCCPLRCEREHTLQKEQTRQKRIEL